MELETRIIRLAAKSWWRKDPGVLQVFMFFNTFWQDTLSVVLSMILVKSLYYSNCYWADFIEVSLFCTFLKLDTSNDALPTRLVQISCYIDGFRSLNGALPFPTTTWEYSTDTTH